MAHQARKRFGQNFLEDQAVIQQIIGHISPQKGQKFIEIGAGKGAITQFILPQVEKMQAIELDRDLVPILAAHCKTLGDLEIIQADALKMDIQQLSPNEKVRVVGNLPYNISTPLLFHLLAQSNKIIDMHFMLQKEVVERICAVPDNKKWGRLSVMIQARSKTSHLFNVDASAFNPVPKVESAIVRITPLEKPWVADTDWIYFAKIVRMAFSQRRKTIRNNLKKLFSDETLLTAGIKPTDRAEKIALKQFIALSQCSPKSDKE